MGNGKEYKRGISKRWGGDKPDSDRTARSTPETIRNNKAKGQEKATSHSRE